MLRTSIDLTKENDFKLKKARSRRYPAQTFTDSDYADDIGLLANIPAQAKSPLYSQEKAPGGIGLMSMRTKQSTCALINITQEVSPA